MQKKDDSGLCNPLRSLQSQHSTRSQLHHRRRIPAAACPGHGTQGSSPPLPCHGPSPSIPCSEHQLQHSTEESIPRADLASNPCSSSGCTQRLSALPVLPRNHTERILLSATIHYKWVYFLIICQKNKKITLILVKYNFLNSKNHTKRLRLQIDGT